MKSIYSITEEEIAAASVANTLPDRPSQPGLYSDRGMTPQEIKEAFDRLPRLIAERFNALVEALTDGTIALSVKVASVGEAANVQPVSSSSEPDSGADHAAKK